MRILFMCNTPYQLIMAVQLKMTVLNKDIVDIGITDRISECEKLASYVKASGTFDNVYVFNVKKFKWPNWKFMFFYNLYSGYIDERVRHVPYDEYYFSNLYENASCYASYFRNKYKTKLNMYEDGFINYSDLYKNALDHIFFGDSLQYKIKYLIKKHPAYYIEKYYVCFPEIINDWKYPFEIVEISKDYTNTLFALNTCFGYDEISDEYKEPVIFFEESYYEDGIEIDDLKVVEKLVSLVGKENIFIKIHPRNIENRFALLGYKTNTNTFVPWEIIALNIDISNKILITISSGSCITSYFSMKTAGKKCIMLYDFDEFDKSKLTSSVGIFDKICKKNDYFEFPKDYDELSEIVNVCADPTALTD